MVKQLFCVCGVAWLSVAVLGCGGATPEIKPKTAEGQMTPEQKKAMDEQIKKSMERSGYGQRGGAQPGTR